MLAETTGGEDSMKDRAVSHVRATVREEGPAPVLLNVAQRGVSTEQAEEEKELNTLVSLLSVRRERILHYRFVFSIKAKSKSKTEE